MHAVIVHVTIHDPETASRTLKEQIVPQVSQAPGFVAGYWCAAGSDKGLSLIVLESEDAARAVAERAQAPGDFITFDSVEVGEIVAHA